MKTFIVATISKNSYVAEKIKEILVEGARVLRFNFSHGTPEEMQAKIGVARNVIEELGLTGQVAIMADLPGNKIRLGYFPTGQYAVKQSDVITFMSTANSDDPQKYIPVDFPEIASYLTIGQMVSCGDGEIGFEVLEIKDKNTFTARALNSLHIPAGKALNVGRGIDDLDHFTDKTIAHIESLAKIAPEWVAFSFVNSADSLRKGKLLLQQHGVNNVKIVSKIESQKGIDNIEAIADECDILLVARGDMGLVMPIEEVGLNQKKIVRVAKAKKKQVIVSTQILDSLLTYVIPSRAEVLDLTNIVLDGADGIMLAKETGISATPGYSVRMAKKIIEAVEKSLV